MSIRAQIVNLLRTNGPQTMLDLQKTTGYSKSSLAREIQLLRDNRSILREYAPIRPGRTRPAYVFSIAPTMHAKPASPESADGKEVLAFLARFQDFDIKGVRDLNLHSGKLSEWFEALGNKNATIRLLPNELMKCIAYCIRTKYAPVGQYEPTIAQSVLRDLESYLVGLAVFVNQLRNDNELWDERMPAKDVLHSNNDKLFAEVSRYSELFMRENGLT